jgi:hypothetical protein
MFQEGQFVLKVSGPKHPKHPDKKTNIFLLKMKTASATSLRFLKWQGTAIDATSLCPDLLLL